MTQEEITSMRVTQKLLIALDDLADTRRQTYEEVVWKLIKSFKEMKKK